MDELLKKDVGWDSRFYAMGVSCGQTKTSGFRIFCCTIDELYVHQIQGGPEHLLYFCFESKHGQEIANVINDSLCNTAVLIEWNKNHCNLCIINKVTLSFIYVMLMW
jgi:hypothetical protein